MRSGTSFAIPPHDGTAAFTVPVSHEPVEPTPVEPMTVEGVEGEVATPGEAVNVESGEVTAPGEPLPVIEQTEGEPLPPAEPLALTPVYDPAEHTVIEVLAYLDTLDLTTQHGVDEYARIVAAEKDGKARATLLSQVVEPTLQTPPTTEPTETVPAPASAETTTTETMPQE